MLLAFSRDVLKLSVLCRGTFSLENAPVSATTDPSTWWELFGQGSKELSFIAKILLSIVPHAADVERVFSMLGWFHTKTRNRLLHSTVTNMAKVKLHHQSKVDSDKRCGKLAHNSPKFR